VNEQHAKYECSRQQLAYFQHYPPTPEWAARMSALLDKTVAERDEAQAKLARVAEGARRASRQPARGQGARGGKMSGHTPGPWVVERILRPFEDGEDQEACGAEISVPNWHGFIQIWEATQEAVEANARLIAAAPEMYKALRSILDGMEASGGWAGDDDLFNAGMSAIAKAEGR
jgi:hypothetical protein